MRQYRDIMSRKLKLAAKEKDKTKINKYTECISLDITTITHNSANSSSDNKYSLVTSINALSSESVKESVASAKRKHSQESTLPNRDQIKKINMSASPQETQQPFSISQLIEDDDESTLSSELAKLERILSRKQTENLEGIKSDIKKLLENEALIKRQQDTITELKRENQELNIKYNQLEQNHHRLQKRVLNRENELFRSNLIFSAISESANEDGPERYRLIIEVIANTINAQTTPSGKKNSD